MTSRLRLQAAARIEQTKVDGTGLDFTDPPAPRRSSPRPRTFKPKSISAGILYELPLSVVARVTAQHVERSPGRRRALLQGRARGNRHLRDRQPRPHPREGEHLRARLQARQGRLPLRRLRLLHQVRRLHLQAGHRRDLRGDASTAARRQAAATSPDPVPAAQRHLLRRRAAGRARHRPHPQRRVGHRRPVRLRARLVRRRPERQRAAHASAPRRPRHLLSRRQLVRAHRLPARLRAGQDRPVRDADRGLHAAQRRPRLHLQARRLGP